MSEEHIQDEHSLRPADIVKTFKTLRNGGLKFKYFQCGEYGTETLRPHHHIIFLGENFSGDRVLTRVRKKRPIWTSRLLRDAWPHGNHEIETASFAAGCYVAGYVTKKLHNQPIERFDPSTGHSYDVVPPYTTMSNGIGTAWYKKYHSDVYPHDYVQLDGDAVSRPPAWYDKLHAKHRPEAWAEVQAARSAFSEQHSHSWQSLRNR